MFNQNLHTTEESIFITRVVKQPTYRNNLEMSLIFFNHSANVWRLYWLTVQEKCKSCDCVWKIIICLYQFEKSRILRVFKSNWRQCFRMIFEVHALWINLFTCIILYYLMHYRCNLLPVLNNSRTAKPYLSFRSCKGKMLSTKCKNKQPLNF